MFKILVVDDETLENDAIRADILKMNLEISTIETAISGFEALNKINKFSPDILITDIMMPGMNGLELAEEIRAKFTDIEIVFISGHDDFSFLKNAIKLEAFEYILKPVDKSELKEVVIKVIDKIYKKKKTKEENKVLLKRVDESKAVMKEKIILDIIFGTAGTDDIWEKVKYFDMDIQKGLYSLLLLEIDDYKILAESHGKTFFESKLSQLDNDANLNKYSICRHQFVMIDSYRCALILSFTSYIDENEMNDEITKIAQYLCDKAKEKEDMSVSVAIGCKVDEIQELEKSYNQCCTILSQKMLTGKGNVLRYYQVPPKMIDNSEFYKIDKELMVCLANLDINKSNHYIDYLFDNIEERGGFNSVYIQNYCINILSHVQLTLIDLNINFDEIFGSGVILWTKLMKFDTILDIRQWMKNIFKSVIEYLGYRNNSRLSKIVEKVIEYIEEGYTRDITIKEIATILFYSPNHIGHLFKSETGQGFSEYLNEYRMKKASEFLKSTTMKTYEIASTVGYSNVNSFIKQFKLVFGITPKEYRGRC